MDDRWKPLSRTGGPVVPFAKTLTPQQLLASAPSVHRKELERHIGAGSISQIDSSEFLIHTVSKSDTIMGLSMQYGVSTTEIRALNDLHSENLATMSTLRIPNSKLATLSIDAVESHASMVRRFRVANNISDAEATFYLDDAAWNFLAAHRQLKIDMEFEASALTSGSTANGTTCKPTVPFREASTCGGESSSLLSHSEPVRRILVYSIGSKSQEIFVYNGRIFFRRLAVVHLMASLS
jgi:hypothetical protein